MFVFSNSRSADHQADDLPESVYKPLHQQLRNMRPSYYPDDDENDESEEFVII